MLSLIWPFVGVLVTVALLIGVVVLGLQSHPQAPGRARSSLKTSRALLRPSGLQRGS